MQQNYIKYNAETPPKIPKSFTGKERDSETGFSYFGARYYDSDILTGWLSVDPMADKYPNISPYAYCAWNPMRLVDPDGKDVWLPGGDLYSPNMKTEGYNHEDAVTIQALNEIYKSEEGKLMIDEICNSNISVGITMTNGETKYKVDGPKEAFFNPNTNKKGTGKDIIMEIFWNYQNPETLPTLNGMEANATFNLLDEICHAYDYSMGNSDNSEFRLWCKKSEFQAVYRSNVVRHQLGNTNYRTHYLVTDDNTKGYGPTTAETNIFYCPSWYGRTSTDKFSMIKEY